MPSILATPTLDTYAGERPSAPTYMLDVSWDGDAAYPAGGSPGFSAYVLAACKAATPPLLIDVSNIVNVIPLDCGGYEIAYVRATDKLIVRWCAAAGSPMAEVTAATDLHTTRFKATVVLR